MAKASKPLLRPEQQAVIRLNNRPLKTYYRFNHETGEIEGEFQSRVDYPPGHASITDQPPGVAKPGHARCLDLVTREWKYVEDHRGKPVYNTLDGSDDRWDAVGPLPKFLTAEKPATPHDEFIDGRWVTNASRKDFSDAVDADADIADIAQKIKTLSLPDIRAHLASVTSTQAGQRQMIIKLGLLLAVIIRRGDL